jgi:hypothetical protein
MRGREIVQRFEQLFSLRKGSIEATWDQIERYIAPMRGGRFYQTQSTEYELRSRRPEIWDLTAIKGLSILVASMQSSLISPAVRWFNLQFKDEELNDNQEANKWLDDCTDILFDQLQDSNFNLEVASSFADLGAFGNTCLTLETPSETEWKGPDFCAIPIREFYFEMDHKGEVLRLYRWLQWTPVQIVDKFKDDLPDSVPLTIRQKAEGSSSQDKIDLIYCVFRREDVEEVADNVYTAPDKRPWGCKYVLRSSMGESEGGGELGSEGGYYRMPAFITRWERLSGSQWGFGPGNIAIPTVKYLNAWMEIEKAAAEKAVDPPILSTERGLLSPPDLRPGGMNVVRTMDDMKPFENKANFQASYGALTELRQMVNEVFKVEDLKLKESPAMTAMEVQVRYEMMTRVLGPPAVRIQNNLLSPSIKNLFHMMARYKQFPAPPGIVLQKPNSYDIEYQGPLMKAQRAQEVASMERLAGIVMNMVKVFPQVQSIFDPINFVREAADRLSVPPEVLNSDLVVKRLEQMRMRSMQLAQAQQEADVAKTKGEAVSAAMEAAQLNQGAQGLEQ